MGKSQNLVLTKIKESTVCVYKYWYSLIKCVFIHYACFKLKKICVPTTIRVDIYFSSINYLLFSPLFFSIFFCTFSSVLFFLLLNHSNILVFKLC